MMAQSFVLPRVTELFVNFTLSGKTERQINPSRECARIQIEREIPLTAFILVGRNTCWSLETTEEPKIVGLELCKDNGDES